MRNNKTINCRPWLTVLIACLSLWGATFATVQAEHRPFNVGSLQEILAARDGRPVMLVLWSMHCSVCLKELPVLAEMRQKYPMLDVVMISTDQGKSEEIGIILDEHDLADLESWNFSQLQIERLRYEIDPSWYGELPRTYFYDQEHKRAGLSGKLKLEHFESWVATAYPEALN